MSSEIIPIITVMFLGLIVLQRSHRGYDSAERALLTISFVGHLTSAFGQVWITRYFYNTGDMVGYERTGAALAALMRDNIVVYSPETVKLILLQQPDLPFGVFGAGDSTGAMSGFTGALFLILNDSLYASCVAVGIASYAGKLALFRAVRGQLQHTLRRRVLVASMLVPSVVFWSSGLTKEAFAIMGLGGLILGAWRLSHRDIRGGLAQAILGTILVAIVKPYILFAAVVSIAAWFYWTRSIAQSGRVRIRPAYLLVAGGSSLIGLVILGRLFPEYAVENFANAAAYNQTIGRGVVGGSNYFLAEQGEVMSVTQQILYAPLALGSALFRPLIIEVQNPLMALNSLETTLVLFLVLRAMLVGSPVALLRRLRASPVLVFCLVFTLTMGVAVGLATTNLGTLSRYRIPMVPFFATLVLVWTAGIGRTRTALQPLMVRSLPPTQFVRSKHVSVASRERLARERPPHE